MSLSDDLYRWRGIVEQAVDAQRPILAAATSGDVIERAPYPDRDAVDVCVCVGATRRLEGLADELHDRYVDALRAEGRRTTETTPSGPGIATCKGGPDGAHEEG